MKCFVLFGGRQSKLKKPMHILQQTVIHSQKKIFLKQTMFSTVYEMFTTTDQLQYNTIHCTKSQHNIRDHSNYLYYKNILMLCSHTSSCSKCFGSVCHTTSTDYCSSNIICISHLQSPTLLQLLRLQSLVSNCIYFSCSVWLISALLHYWYYNNSTTLCHYSFQL
jgi:hypothetical protein